ncbi:TetR/AcrR family transcriptional regulator [Fredinandcohnia sp. 179-A 10B2 NHS]|uniref:TetR/AcrR family transcriptional regulator n=1 Tax=Fredinandcohnia sp. 179-A 10B2 NHS TaxID=3235176 RepID=UPI0039A355AA
MPPIVSEEYKEKKKKEILKSAMKAFGEKGYQVATIDDIVAYSGMSKGAIYNYFESKEDIYVQLMNAQTERDLSRFKQETDALSTSTEKLRYFFTTFSGVNLNEQKQRSIQVQIEFFLNSGRDKQLKKLMIDRFKNLYQKLLKDIIDEGKRTGEFGSDVESEIIAALFWGILDGVSLHYSVIGDQDLYRNTIKKAEEIVLQHVQR